MLPGEAPFLLVSHALTPAASVPATLPITGQLPLLVNQQVTILYSLSN